jgi:hypothetical protein
VERARVQCGESIRDQVRGVGGWRRGPRWSWLRGDAGCVSQAENVVEILSDCPERRSNDNKKSTTIFRKPVRSKKISLLPIRYKRVRKVCIVPWCVVLSLQVCQPSNIDESYYKGMRLRRDAAARAGTKRGARGAQRRGEEERHTSPSLWRAITHTQGGKRKEVDWVTTQQREQAPKGALAGRGGRLGDGLKVQS